MGGQGTWEGAATLKRDAVSLNCLYETVGEHAVGVPRCEDALLNKVCVEVHVGRRKVAPEPEVCDFIPGRQVRDAAGR